MNNIILRYRNIFFLGCFFLLIFENPSFGQTDSVLVIKNEKEKTVPFGTTPEWMVTGAGSQTKGSNLEKSFNVNLANRLYGEIPGLTIQQYNTEAGEDSPNMLSRGISTLFSNSILVIVDGFESSIENLVPEEIESITLLKDAASTALYGSRAANGVLEIRTKRGSNKALQVSFSTQHGIQSSYDLPPFLGSYDYARLYNEALENDGKAPVYSEEDLAAYQSGTDPYFHPDVNWYDEVLRKTAPIRNYNLSFNGGSETVSYFVLLNALSSNGLYKKTEDISDNSINSKYERYNIRSNIDIQVSSKIKANFNIAGAIINKDNPAGNSTAGIFSRLKKIAPNAFPVYNPNGSWGGNNLYSNPLGDIMESGFYSSDARTLQAMLKLTGDLRSITKGLSISGAVSFNDYFQSFSSKTRSYQRFSISENGAGDVTYNPIGENTSLTGNEGGSVKWRRYTLQGILNYNRTFGKNMLRSMLYISGDNYLLRNAETYDLTSFPYRHNHMGGRFSYAWNQKYIGEFSFGVSGSENFPKENRYGFFPAVSLGWIASEENFAENISWLDYLKVRASYGLVGNDDIGGQRFMYNSTYTYGSEYHLGTDNSSIYTIQESAYSNPNLTWEKSQKLNIGFDATILKHLDVTVDVFNEKRSDILAKPYATVPAFLGIELPDLNVGEVTNKGVEVSLFYKSNSQRDLVFSLEGSMWYAKNELTFYSEAPQLYDYMYRTGQMLNQPFGYEAIGFFKSEEDIAGSPLQTFSSEVLPGDIKYKDMNDDGIINQLDIHPIGNTETPTMTFMFRPTFEYKNFDFSMLLQGVAGRTVYLNGDFYQAFQNDGKIGEVALGRWNASNKENATYPRLSSENNANNFGVYSSFWQKNGNYIKLRNVELGYNLPDELMTKWGLLSARFFINGTNLFSLDHLEYSDPEIMNGYPPIRTYSIGCKIQF